MISSVNKHICLHFQNIFRFVAVSLTFLATGNRDVSSANSLAEQQSLDGRSFIQIKINIVPIIDP